MGAETGTGQGKSAAGTNPGSPQMALSNHQFIIGPIRGVTLAMLSSLFKLALLCGSLALLNAQTYNPLGAGCIATATHDNDCFYYAFDTFKQNAGFGKICPRDGLACC